MTQSQRRINEARFRLNLNAFLDAACVGVAVGATGWALAVAVDRAFALNLRSGMTVSFAAAAALLTALLLWSLRRVDRLAAAVALDGAAGLKERLSTELVCVTSPDAFARAACGDADRFASELRVAAHMPYRAPRSWPAPALAVVAAALVAGFMPVLDLLSREPQATAEQRTQVEAERQAVTAQVNQKIEAVAKLASNNPELKSLGEDLKPLELPTAPNVKPDDIRNEAVKKLDKLSDLLARQKNADVEDQQKQLKRMLAQLEARSNETQKSELTEALASGDFSGAKKELENARKLLAEAKSGDAEAAKKLAEMQKKLEAIAAQIEKAADATQLQKELENKAGLSEQQAKELLKHLSKMDAKQLEKELQKRLGDKMAQEQLKKLAQKLANNQQAQKKMNELGQKMAQAAQCMKNQQGGQQQQSSSGGEGESQPDADSALEEAADQLSEMEMNEQQLQELEAKLAEIDELKNCIGQGNCPNPDPNQIGGQGPQFGLGRGGGSPKEKVAHQLKAEKAKVRPGAGQIIGQMLVNGGQVKGDAQAEARAAITAAVRDATDAISRDDVLRQHERVVRTYFDRLAGLAGETPAPASREPAPASSDDD
ncbi:MAG: hypothetical protein CHACPFDD_02491 [Phycisphaerae bacterium]|nr:hypothetical protein [Phycisphaerae bacterium]